MKLRWEKRNGIHWGRRLGVMYGIYGERGCWWLTDRNGYCRKDNNAGPYQTLREAKSIAQQDFEGGDACTW